MPSSVSRREAVTTASRAHYLALLHALGAQRRVLEYGCGPGGHAFHLARRGAEVIGVDISGQAIALARRRARAEGLEGRCTFAVMNPERLGFSDRSFDLVCGRGILHHLDLARAFHEVARVLRPEGSAVFQEPLGHNPLIRLYRRLTPELRTPDEHPLLETDLALARRHFEVVRTTPYHLGALAAVPLMRMPGFDRVLRALETADALAIRLAPSLGRHAWKFVLELAQPRLHAADAPGLRAVAPARSSG